MSEPAALIISNYRPTWPLGWAAVLSGKRYAIVPADPQRVPHAARTAGKRTRSSALIRVRSWPAMMTWAWLWQ